MLLLLWLWTALAAGASLTDVRVFSGDGHARLLLVFDAPPGVVQPRQQRSAAGAAVVVAVADASPGPEGARTLPLDDPSVGPVDLVEAPNDTLELVVRLARPRTPAISRLGDHAVLVDLVEEGRGEDPALPSREQLQAWLDGTGLSRPQPARPAGRRLVVIDAGHGGWDHGAVGTTGTREADIALQLALRTARVLEERYGCEVVLSRETDVFVELRDRAALANARDADLFVSIHANAAPGPTAWGIETYSFDSASDKGAARVARRENAVIRDQRSEDGTADPLLARMLVAGTNALSRRLSAEVQQASVERLRASYGDDQIRDLGSKTALFYVLVSTRMPSILFEAGFLSNPDDERRLRTPHYQQEVAEALGMAVDRWFSSADARRKGAQ